MRPKFTTMEEVFEYGEALGLTRDTAEFWHAVSGYPFQTWLDGNGIEPGDLLRAGRYPGADRGLVEIPSGEKESHGRIHPYYGDASTPSKCTRIAPGSVVMYLGLNTYFNDDSGIFSSISFLHEEQVVFWLGGIANDDYSKILNTWFKVVRQNHAA